MATVSLNDIWTFLNGMSLSSGERKWLADKLIETGEAESDHALAQEERKRRLLALAGCWNDAPDGEELYEHMKQWLENRNGCREILQYDD